MRALWSDRQIALITYRKKLTYQAPRVFTGGNELISEDFSLLLTFLLVTYSLLFVVFSVALI